MRRGRANVHDFGGGPTEVDGKIWCVDNVVNRGIAGMFFHPNERIALFIDGANLYATAKALAFCKAMARTV